MSPAPLLLVAVASLSASILAGRVGARTWLALVSLGTAAGLGASLAVLLGAGDLEWRSTFAVGGEPLHVRLDALGAVFVALLCVVGGAGAVYARTYWSDAHHPASAPRSRAWWSASLVCLGLVMTASNGLHFLIAWELFAVCSYVLITLERGRAEVAAAGWLYLAASHAGTLFLFAFFASLAAQTGGWDLGPLTGRTDLAPLFWLALVGFGLKAGMFPLHVWLPSAHASAPSHVSALMSGVAIKLGVYGLLRFSGWLPVPAAAGWVVLGLGATSALLGIVFALVQTDVKRLLAYCSVENVGVILVGLGAALLARAHGDPPWGRLALAGALLHVWNHGAFKALLFFGAGAVLHATGTREMSRLGGLWRRMPGTAALFVVGAVAVSGLPPLNGFVSEWMVYLGLFGSAAGRDPSSWATLPAAIVLAMTGALALASFVKAGTLIFLGAPRTKAAAEARECSRWMRAPMVALAALCVAIGLAPALLWPALARATEAWHSSPGTASPPPPPPSLTPLGVAHVVLVLLVGGVGAALWSRIRANGVRRAPTWGCGYASPTPRMQYTGGSFAGIVLGWFAWILRPEVRTRRPRGPFPAHASRLERVPETVLERGLAPVGAVLLAVSTAVRRLQHGRLQAYLLYLVAGLVALGALLAFGGRP